MLCLARLRLLLANLLATMLLSFLVLLDFLCLLIDWLVLRGLVALLRLPLSLVFIIGLLAFASVLYEKFPKN